jgi:uncharacterized protein
MIIGLSLRRAMAATIVLTALAGIALGLPGQARAQALPPPPQVTPAQLLLAKQIVQIKGVNAMFSPLIRGVVQKTKDTVLQTNIMWAKDLNEIALNIEKEYQPRSTEVIDASARYYASHFSEAELKQILTFYQSPVGQKMLVEEPKALDETMAYAGEWGDNLSIDVMNKLRAEMKKRGHDM